MQTSKRHHYIPQFIIKQFADSDGMLYLYDKETRRFAKRKQSTKSVFFEMNRNTADIGGFPSDNMEKLYADIDARFSKDLNEILTNDTISVESLSSILMMISLIKWRVPSQDIQFEKYDAERQLEDLPINIKVVNNDTSESTDALQHLINSELFSKTKRFIFPLLPFYEGQNISEEKILRVYTSSYVNSNHNIKSILGDVPLIEDSTSNIDNFGNFIFPLSTTHTFICSDSCNKKIKGIEFYLIKDLAIFHQSTRYVVCKDKEYLQHVIDAYNETLQRGKAQFLNEYVFKYI